MEERKWSFEEVRKIEERYEGIIDNMKIEHENEIKRIEEFYEGRLDSVYNQLNYHNLD